MKNFQRILILLLISVFITNQSVYACRLFGSVADFGYELSGNNNENDGNQIRTYLELNDFRGQGDDDHPNGWGMLFYSDLGSGTTRYMEKFNSSVQANEYNSGFSNARNILIGEGQNTTTILAHVRRSSSGATGIPDPHPWIMEYNGATYTFAHNGTINDKVGLKNIIGVDWINDHGGLQTFGHGAWEDNLDYVVDSELYFFWIMKNVEESNGDILQGIHQALSSTSFTNIINHSTESLNFLFSNGEAIWGYRKAQNNESNNVDLQHTLYYCDSDYENAQQGLSFHLKTITSQETLSQNFGAWVNIPNGTLVYLPRIGDIEVYDNFIYQDMAETKTLHSSWNWVGFPVLGDIEGTNVVDVLQNVAPDALQIILNGGVNSSYQDGVWSSPININSKQGVKLRMAETYAVYPLYTVGDKIAQDASVTLSPGINWVSYFVNETQSPFDALPATVLDNISSIRGQHWYMYKKGTQWYGAMPSGCDGPEPSESCPLFVYGQMYELNYTGSTSTDFSYNYNGGIVRGVTKEGTIYQYEELDDYTALTIETVTDPESVIEIAAFIGDKCVAAEPAKGFPVYMQIYNGADSMDDLSFQIVRDGGLAKSIPDNGTPIGHDNMFKEHYKLAKMDRDVTDDGFVLYKAEIEKSDEVMIMETSLLSAYPNPFNPSTTLRYALAKHEHVSVVIYDMSGRVVENLYQGQQDRGQYELTWNGSDVASGMYFVVFKTSAYQSTQKVMLLK